MLYFQEERKRHCNTLTFPEIHGLFFLIKNGSWKREEFSCGLGALISNAGFSIQAGTEFIIGLPRNERSNGRRGPSHLSVKVETFPAFEEAQAGW